MIAPPAAHFDNVGHGDTFLGQGVADCIDDSLTIAARFSMRINVNIDGIVTVPTAYLTGSSA